MTDDEARAATGAAAVDTSPNSPTGKLLDFVVDHWNEESSFTVADANKVLVDGADINAQTPVEAVEVRACATTPVRCQAWVWLQRACG